MCRLFGLLIVLVLAAPAAADPWTEAEAALADKAEAEAVKLYAEALRDPDSLPVAKAWALARYGLALRLGGRYDEAERALAAALAAAREDGDRQVEGVALRYRGRLRFDRGDSDAALADYRASAERLAQTPARGERVRTLIALAGMTYQQSQSPEAYRLYAEALESARQLGDEKLEEVALLGLAWVLRNLGDTVSAAWLLEQAEQIAERSGHGWRVLRARVERAFTLLEAGRLREAARLATRVRPALPETAIVEARQCALVEAHVHLRSGRPEAALAALSGIEGENVQLLDEVEFARAEALLALGRVDEADEATRKGLKLADLGFRVTRGIGVSARVALARGQHGRARVLLERYLEETEARRGRLAPSQLTYFSHPNRQRNLELLLGLYVEQGETRRAAELVQRIKSFALTEQLVADRLRGRPAPWEASRTNEDAALFERVRGKSATPPPPISVDDLRGRLERRDVVLDYYLLSDELLVFAYTSRGLNVRRRPVGRQSVAAMVRAMRRSIIGQDPAWETAARPLADTLLGEVAGLLSGVEHGRLVVIPHGVLHGVSFPALPFKAGLLVDRFDVARAPGIGALTLMLGSAPRELPATPTVLAVGDAEKDLPEAWASVQWIAGRFPGARAITREGATEGAVKSLVAGSDLVHLAVHGHQAELHRPAQLVLRPGEGQDGRLYADEVLEMDLAARLVVLSACESGVGEPTVGDDVPGVLDRAFLLAGADAVVSSLWRIDDHSTARLMRHFYEGLPGQPRLRAFAEAQRALRLTSSSEARVAMLRKRACRGMRPCDRPRVPLSHPYHWAGFVYLGDPR